MLVAYPVRAKYFLMLLVSIVFSATLRAADAPEQTVSSSVGQGFLVAANENSPLQTDNTSSRQGKSLIGWLEKTINPVYQWVSNLRSSSSEEVKHSPIVINGQEKAEQFSASMTKAIAAASRRYDGIVLSVKRLTEEESVYRIKLLRRSGELHALDYNEERDQFISGDDGDWYANSID